LINILLIMNFNDGKLLKLNYNIEQSMSDKKEDPIEQIKKSPLREVLVRGFAELIKVKPDFPVEYLGHWLKEYSSNQARQKELDSTREEKHKRVVEM